MSDDSADKRAVGAHPESFSGRAYPRWTSWTQADPDPTCFRSCIVDTQHRRAVAYAAAKLSELQIRSSALSNLVPRCRILVRWEYYAQNFLGFVQLACPVALFRRF